MCSGRSNAVDVGKAVTRLFGTTLTIRHVTVTQTAVTSVDNGHADVGGSESVPIHHRS